MIDTTASTIVRGAYIELTDESFGNIKRLYRHQLETMNSSSDVIVLDAPTGTGKTLAALACVFKRGESAIFIYPTNTLVEDQTRAIQDLILQLGKRVNRIDDTTNLDDALRNVAATDIDLIVLTGAILESVSEGTSKGSVIERIFKTTYKENRMRILLTNPDTLYLTESGKYHLYQRIAEQLDTFQMLVIDEFHLYSGPTLARLFLMLNRFRRTGGSEPKPLLFLSATHGDMLQLLQDSFSNMHLIKPKIFDEWNEDRRRIRHETICTLIGQNDVMFGIDHARMVARDILDYYLRDHTWDKSPNVKVLGIFNSVTFAAAVTNEVILLLKEHGIDTENVLVQINGFIPRSARPRIDDLHEAILVGTSAIEVGIDFDVPFMVIEAHDLASFLQRFGRGGRHNKCHATLYIPREMVDRVAFADEWKFSHFIEEAKQAFKSLPSYAAFLCSDQVIQILLTMALSACKLPKKRNDEYDYDQAVEYFRYLASVNGHVKFKDKRLVDNTTDLNDDTILQLLRKKTVKAMVQNGFLRGTMNSFIVAFPGGLLTATSDTVYALLDILELYKLKGTLEDIDKHINKIPRHIKRVAKSAKWVFVVDKIEFQSRPRVYLNDMAYQYYGKKTGVFDNSIISVKPNSHIARIIEKMLNERNLVYLLKDVQRRLDYRIPRIYTLDGNGALIVGDWALIGEYLSQSDNREEDWT